MIYKGMHAHIHPGRMWYYRVYMHGSDIIYCPYMYVYAPFIGILGEFMYMHIIDKTTLNIVLVSFTIRSCQMLCL